MSLKEALLAAAALALPAAAAGAQPVTGLYLGAGAGVNIRHDSRSNGVEVVSENPGFAGVGAIGWGFGNGLRFEVEGNYRENSVEKLTLGGLPPVRSSAGYIRTYGAMGNVLFDLNIPALPVVPYIGVGAGYAWSDWKNGRFSRGASTYRIDDMDGRFAYQGIAGRRLQRAPCVPGLALTAEYRFLGTLEHEIDTDSGRRAAAHDAAAGFEAGQLQPLDPARPALRLRARRAAAGRRRRAPAVARAGAGAHLPRLLRLEPRRPDRRARGRSSPRRRRTRAPRADHADRGGRPRRPLRHAAVQPAPVASAARTRWRRSSSATACRARHRSSRPSARAARWCRPPTACASRRTAASRSSCADRPAGTQRLRKGRR